MCLWDMMLSRTVLTKWIGQIIGDMQGDRALYVVYDVFYWLQCEADTWSKVRKSSKLNRTKKVWYLLLLLPQFSFFFGKWYWALRCVCTKLWNFRNIYSLFYILILFYLRLIEHVLKLWEVPEYFDRDWRLY